MLVQPDTEAVFRHLGHVAIRLPTPSDAFPMWLIDADCGAQGEARALLSNAELTRADRFRTAALRDRYVAAHASLRALLWCHYGVAKNEQTFQRNGFGKPRLQHYPHIDFNMSYGGRYALIGISEDHEIGVDIERLRPISDAEELAPLYFTDLEQLHARRACCSGSGVSDAFLSMWTRKEAFVKAVGCGLSMPLKDVECGTPDVVTAVEFGERRYRVGNTSIVEDYVMAWALDEGGMHRRGS